jgi:hypothetical protein
MGFFRGGFVFLGPTVTGREHNTLQKQKLGFTCRPAAPGSNL